MTAGAAVPGFELGRRPARCRRGGRRAPVPHGAAPRAAAATSPGPRPVAPPRPNLHEAAARSGGAAADRGRCPRGNPLRTTAATPEPRPPARARPRLPEPAARPRDVAENGGRCPRGACFSMSAAATPEPRPTSGARPGVPEPATPRRGTVEGAAAATSRAAPPSA